jgi:uroporphyrinogen-III decarboxylase
MIACTCVQEGIHVRKRRLCPKGTVSMP